MNINIMRGRRGIAPTWDCTKNLKKNNKSFPWCILKE